ncbi:MAG: hypothetical protein U1E66_05335 [Rhodospirillales bacterium]
MTAKELERLLALRTGFGAAHLDQTTRALRAAGLLPAGRRGRGARSLDGTDAAMLLLALAAADQPARAPFAARTYADLRLVGSGTPSTLVDAIAAATTDLNQAAAIRTVLICRSWPMATITRPAAFEIREDRYAADTSATLSTHEAPIFCGLSGRLLHAVASAVANHSSREACGVPA